MILGGLLLGMGAFPADQKDIDWLAVTGWSVAPFSGDLSGKYGVQALAAEIHHTSGGLVTYWPSVRFLKREPYPGARGDFFDVTGFGSVPMREHLIRGEVLSCHLEGWHAFATVRLMDYCLALGRVTNGADASADGLLGDPEASDDERLGEAIRLAVRKAFRELNSRKVVRAKVLSTRRNSALLDKGWRSGWKVGIDALIFRGIAGLGDGSTGIVRANRSELFYRRISMGVAPGDSVFQMYSNERFNFVWPQ